MSSEKTDVIIIGGGLSGLALAYYLQKSNISYKIIEARNRIGGRINTLALDDCPPLEMGATWLGAKHKSLLGLLNELKLEIFIQELGEIAVYEPISTSPHQIVSLPPNNDPSFRIKGGTKSLVDALYSNLKDEDIHLGEEAQEITKSADEIILKTSKQEITAKKIVSTLPPFLFFKRIAVKPQLPDSLKEVMRNTHTWMGESIKISLTFKEPFWRSDDLSGTIFSNVGPIPEMYDHSNFEDNLYALKGFLNGNYFSYSKEQRLELILRQLRKYYGSKIDSFVRYEETVWRDEKYTFTPYDDHILPHQNNGHQLYQKSFLDNSLFIGGAETATTFPGYMDGAVSSAKYVAQQIKGSS